MMMLRVVCVVALALCAALVVAETYEGAFIVDLDDQLCTNDSDCTSIGSTCCSNANCDSYQPVNVSTFPKYQTLLAEYETEHCSDVGCPKILCLPPPVKCLANPAKEGRKFCALAPNVGAVAFEEVAPEDQACETVKDCAYVPYTCCASSHCNYFPVNVTAKPRYDRIYQDFVSRECISVMCLAVICEPPPLQCIPAARGDGNVCAFKSKEPCDEVHCLRDPCDGAKCPAHPDATCQPNYCNGCNAEWFDTAGVKVDCDEKPPCDIVQCLRNPCDDAKCPAHPDATCEPNYCGGCNTEWYNEEGVKVNCEEDEKPCAEAHCLRDPCVGAECPTHPDATCKPNYCTGCHAEWFNTEGVKVDCAPAQDPCPDGVRFVECLRDPCDDAVCPKHPDAVCEADYCGGCTAVFKVKGEKVECDIVRPPEPILCPSGVPQVQCLVDPCSVTECPAYPNADCKPDYCGGCRAIFSVEGRRVNCDEGCFGLSCDACHQKKHCKYCKGDYAVSERLGDKREFGFCVAASSAAEKFCLDNRGALLTAADTCPAVPTPVTDTVPLQEEIDASEGTVRERFVILVTLVLNENSDTLRGLNVVRMFVDLVGPDTPSDSDKEEVCEILKKALTKVDSRIPRDLLECELQEKTSKKRDVAYVASLSYPAESLLDNNNNSAQALLASVAAVAFALAAVLF